MTALWRRLHAGALIGIKPGAQKKPSFLGE
ncbi:hypothetical protein ABIA72_003264 [Stenotrophomonas rhizophila]